jgi:hypothetical protein
MEKTLADFADFVKQIELDDNGAMTNVEYYDNTCWHKMQDMSIITYVNFVTDKIRIKLKPQTNIVFMVINYEGIDIAGHFEVEDV